MATSCSFLDAAESLPLSLPRAPAELGADTTPRQPLHPVTPHCPSHPRPRFPEEGTGGVPRGSLPSAPLPGDCDPSPLTSSAPQPRAHISSVPTEERAAGAPGPSGACRLGDLRTADPAAQDPGATPRSPNQAGEPLRSLASGVLSGALGKERTTAGPGTRREPQPGAHERILPLRCAPGPRHPGRSEPSMHAVPAGIEALGWLQGNQGLGGSSGEPGSSDPNLTLETEPLALE